MEEVKVKRVDKTKRNNGTQVIRAQAVNAGEK